MFTGGEKVRNLASIVDRSYLLVALVLKRNNIGDLISLATTSCMVKRQ